MYGKLFASMYDGTLYGNWKALVTFQQMIILADRTGIVDMTPQAMAARTSIPLKIIQEGLAVLEAPDEFSRSPEAAGRRIERLDATRPWGWRIVNYLHYRELASADEKRAKDRERIAKKRRKATPSDMSQTVADVAHADADADAYTPLPPKRKTRKPERIPFPEDFTLTADLASYATERLPGVDASALFESFRSKSLAKGWRYVDWRHAFQEFVRNSAPKSGHFAAGQYPKAAGGTVWE